MSAIIMEPLVSVVIPTHNAAQYLGEALESVFSQSYGNLEILVVDDGSTDGTAALLGSFASRLTYLSQEKSGPSKARNTGITNARGEYVAFLDADDIWLSNKIEKQVEILQKNPDAAFVYAQSQDFDDQTDRETTVHPENVCSGNLFEMLLVRPLVTLSSVVMKSSILLDVGGFDEALATAEDTHLYLKIARNYKIIGIPEILVRKRKHKKNLSDRIDVEIGSLACLDRIVRTFPDTEPGKYLPMRNAYLIKGKAMMLDYFYSGAYAKCRMTARKLFRMRLFSPELIGYFVLTLFPPLIVTSVRSFNRLIYKALSHW